MKILQIHENLLETILRGQGFIFSDWRLQIVYMMICGRCWSRASPTLPLLHMSNLTQTIYIYIIYRYVICISSCDSNYYSYYYWKTKWACSNRISKIVCVCVRYCFYYIWFLWNQIQWIGIQRFYTHLYIECGEIYAVYYTVASIMFAV